MPVGAALFSERVAAAAAFGDHGSTYGGNLLACRAALVFKSGRKTIASKSGKIAGGDSRYITLKLSKAAKKQLAKARKLKVAATLTALEKRPQMVASTGEAADSRL